jgi:hypothetical protein
MFKEADFTVCQASFQTVLPTEDDISTVNDTCPKNKQFSCTVKYKELKGISSCPASRYIAWGLETPEQQVLRLRSGPDSLAESPYMRAGSEYTCCNSLFYGICC